MASPPGPKEFTIDWAEASDDASNWADFKGNRVYIGTSPISLINSVIYLYFITQGVRSTSHL